MTISPYYDDGKGVVIYHGDCEFVIPALFDEQNSFDLLLTDPPFGIGNFVQTTGNVRGESVKWNEKPPSQLWLSKLRLVARHHIIWGANYLNCFSPAGGALIWIKNQPMPDFSKAEIASCSFYKKIEIVTITWTNFVNTKESNHPCERPVALYEWCINYDPSNPLTILDPYMGSGSVLRAAKNLGRKCIGIELEERYCEIAAKRLAQEVFDFNSVNPNS